MSTLIRKRKVHDFDELDDVPGPPVAIKIFDKDKSPRIPLSDKGKSRAHEFGLDNREGRSLDNFQGLDLLQVFSHDDASECNTPGLTLTSEADDYCEEDALSEPAAKLASSSSEWAGSNAALLREYVNLQVEPPLGTRLDIKMRERNQFTQAFLSHLSERPSNLMSSEDGAPATGSTEMLDGYLDLQRWAQEYLRRIGQGQAGDIIAVLYVIMSNAFYECHISLVEEITRRALDNMRSCSRSSLKLEDFALKYELNISQTFPFGLHASTVVERAIETLHQSRTRLKENKQQETRSGRKITLSTKGQLYQEDERQKAAKKDKTVPSSNTQHNQEDQSVLIMCPNCGHKTNAEFSSRTSLWTSSSWQQQQGGNANLDSDTTKTIGHGHPGARGSDRGRPRGTRVTARETGRSTAARPFPFPKSEFMEPTLRVEPQNQSIFFQPSTAVVRSNLQGEKNKVQDRGAIDHSRKHLDPTSTSVPKIEIQLAEISPTLVPAPSSNSEISQSSDSIRPRSHDRAQVHRDEPGTAARHGTIRIPPTKGNPVQRPNPPSTMIAALPYWALTGSGGDVTHDTTIAGQKNEPSPSTAGVAGQQQVQRTTVSVTASVGSKGFGGFDSAAQWEAYTSSRIHPATHLPIKLGLTQMGFPQDGPLRPKSTLTKDSEVQQRGARSLMSPTHDHQTGLGEQTPLAGNLASISTKAPDQHKEVTSSGSISRAERCQKLPEIRKKVKKAIPRKDVKDPGYPGLSAQETISSGTGSAATRISVPVAEPPRRSLRPRKKQKLA